MVGFVIAMNNEAQTLIRQAGNVLQSARLGRALYTGKFCGHDIVVIVCGIGKVNAAVCTQYLIDKYGVDKIINFGLAGGIGKGIEIGDIFYVGAAVQYDFDLSLVNNCDIGKLEEFEDKFFKTARVNGAAAVYKILASGDRFNEDKTDEKLLTQDIGAHLRDMEGAAIAHAAQMNGVDAYLFKAVSDKIEKDSVKSYKENSAFALKRLENRLKEIFGEIMR